MAFQRPDLSKRPLMVQCERQMSLPPNVLYPAWCTNEFGRWFAKADAVSMTAEVDAPYFFESEMDGQRHPHYGRMLRLEENRIVEMTWMNEMGTNGAETVVTVELEPSGDGTRIRITHTGFPNEELKKGHDDAWPFVLEHLEKTYQPRS